MVGHNFSTFRPWSQVILPCLVTRRFLPGKERGHRLSLPSFESADPGRLQVGRLAQTDSD